MPKSLTDLNDYSSLGFQYIDPGTFNITFSNANTTNQTISTTEDSGHYVPVGVNITALSAVPSDVNTVRYTINGNTVGANLYCSWVDTEFPDGLVLTNPSAGVYTLTNLTGLTDWSDYKSPLLIAKDRANNWSYTGNIQYPNPSNVAATLSKAWTNTVTVGSSHNELTGGSAETYTEDTTQDINNNPYISDEYAGPGNYTLTIAPDNTAAVFRVDIVNTLGVTSTWNTTTKTRTLVGTKAQINQSLTEAGFLTLIPAADFGSNYNLVYSLTNPISGLVTAYSQAWTVSGAHGEYSIGTSYNYTEDEPLTLSHSITDVDPSVVDYQHIWQQIAPDPTANPGQFIVDSVRKDPDGYYAEFGSKSALNSRNIQFDPPPDYAGSITLYYTQYKNDAQQGMVLQASNVSVTLTNTSSHNDYSLTTTYNYTEDTDLALVSSITDTDATANGYTVTWTQTSPDPATNPGRFKQNSTYGAYGAPGVKTGTKTQVNATTFAYDPPADYTGTINLLYNQVKADANGLNYTQANVGVTLTNISATSEYTLTTAYNYAEDAPATLTWDVTDTDADSTWTVTWDQASPNKGTTPGRFIVDGTKQGFGNAWSYTSNNKTTLNNLVVQYDPPSDYTGTVGLTYSQSKVNSGGNVVIQANAVAVTGTCTSTHTDFSVTNLVNFVEYIQNPVTFQITDTDTDVVSYFVSISGEGQLYVDGVATASPWEITDSKVNINAKTVTWYPPGNPASSYYLYYTQKKNDAAGSQITQASNYLITMSIDTTPRYVIPGPLSFNEDQAISLSNWSVADYGKDYSIGLASAPHGTFFNTSNSYSYGNSVTLTGNKATIDGLYDVINWIPGTDQNANAVITYNQINTTNNWVNAANVAVPLTFGTPQTDYTLTASYSYTQDKRVPLQFTVGDTDTDVSSYNLTVTQVTPDPATAPGYFYDWSGSTGNSTQTNFGFGSGVNNTINYPTSANIAGQSAGFQAKLNFMGNSAYTGGIANVTGYNFNYFPPSNHTSNIGLTWTLSKTNYSTSVTTVLANAVPITLTCANSQANLYSAVSSYSVVSNSPVTLGFTIDDWDRVKWGGGIGPVDAENKGAYYYKITQVSPAPTTASTKGFLHSSTLTAGNLTYTGNSSTVTNGPGGGNALVSSPTLAVGSLDALTVPPIAPYNVVQTGPGTAIIYYSPPDYSGNVQLSLDIYKTRNGANVVVANAVPLTIAVSADGTAKYGVPSSRVGCNTNGYTDMALDVGGGVIQTMRIDDTVGNTFKPTQNTKYDYSGGANALSGTYDFTAVHTTYNVNLSVSPTNLGNLWLTTGTEANVNPVVNLGTNYTWPAISKGEFNRLMSGNDNTPEDVRFRAGNTTGNVTVTMSITRNLDGVVLANNVSWGSTAGGTFASIQII